MHEQLHFCGGFHSISGVQILQRGEQRAIKVTKKKKKKGNTQSRTQENGADSESFGRQVEED